MKKLKKISAGLMAWTIALVGIGLTGGLGACGGGDDDLVISPAGPVIVEKGSTQQFTANLVGVTWSVEGGAANGTIDSNGLYTPPSTLPIDPEVTVVASLPDAEDSALVELRTADDVTFPDISQQVSDTPIDGSILFQGLIIGGMADRLAVSLASVHTNVIWFQGSSSDIDIFFSQSLDFAPFGAERNLTSASSDNFIASSIVNDENLNPQILAIQAEPTGTPIPQVSFLKSDDEGASFSAPLAVAPGSTPQAYSAMKRDGDGDLHVVFVQGDSISVFVAGTILYTRSSDDGATWSTPVPVAPSPTLPVGNSFPYLSVDPSGESIHVCYSVIPNIATITESTIAVARSLNGGSSFEAAVDIPAPAGAGDLLCRNAIGPNGEIYLVYSEDTPADEGQVLFSASTDNGATYSDPTPVNSDSAGTQAFGMLAVDSLGRIDVVWASDDSGGDEINALMYARSVDGGANFSDNIPLAGGGLSEGTVPLGIRHDESGRVHVLYSSDINDPGISQDIFYLVGQ